MFFIIIAEHVINFCVDSLVLISMFDQMYSNLLEGMSIMSKSLIQSVNSLTAFLSIHFLLVFP